MNKPVPHESEHPPAATQAALSIHKLRHAYADKDVLSVESLTLNAGQQMAVLGPSGCGKTTLLHLIAGLLQPTQGSITIHGCDLTRLKTRERDRFRGRQLGLIFQRLYLLPALSVLQNLLLAQRLARVPVNPAAAHALLANLDIAEWAHARPATLSQGQAQRVAIARALVHKPTLLLADEPTSSLDDGNAERALNLLRKQAESLGAGLLVVTHDNRVRGAFEREIVLETCP